MIRENQNFTFFFFYIRTNEIKKRKYMYLNILRWQNTKAKLCIGNNCL